MIGRWLCRLGWHDWLYTHGILKRRYCARCGQWQRQELISTADVDVSSVGDVNIPVRAVWRDF
jgi:hypothetical protein